MKKGKPIGTRERDRLPVWAVCLWTLGCIMAVLLWRFVSWVFHNWANLRMDELIYTLGVSVKGTNPYMIKSAVLYTAPAALAAGAVGLLIVFFLRTCRRRRIFCLTTGILSLIAVLGAIVYFGEKVGYREYMANQSRHSDFISEHYVDPGNAELRFPEKKRNLIFLYVESLEVTYADVPSGGAKPVNVIPEMTRIGLENETFAGSSGLLNGGYALYGATYTMGGIFAQTAGLPLIPENQVLAMQEGFLPGLTALGDILHDAGYRNVFCIGTDAAFGERDRYFTTHGQYEIMDYNYSVEHGEINGDYARDWWGYDDYILYENAKKHLLELASEDQPFNFTMLTVDTHAEDGYLCSRCSDTFGEKYSNVFHCADHMAAEFIRWVQEQDFYGNTTIVAVGDHCTMDSDYCADVPEDYQRKAFTVYINPAQTPVSDLRREYSTMDTFPTTLAALGVGIGDERLGLGTNLFSDRETLVEEYGAGFLDWELRKKSGFFSAYLRPPVERDSEAEYNEAEEVLTITLDGDVSYSGQFDGILCTVRHDYGGFSMDNGFDMEKIGDRYEVRVPLSSFFNAAGEYEYSLSLKLPDGLTKLYCVGSATVDRVSSKPDVSISRKKDSSVLTVVYRDQAGYRNIWFPVWTLENNQDDLQFYEGRKTADGEWTAKIQLSRHGFAGDLAVEVYGGMDAPKTKLYTHVITLK